MHKLRIFLWAALHHEQFRYCYLILPITIRFYQAQPHTWRLELRLQTFSTYVPWTVQSAYLGAKGYKPDLEDIPF